MVVLLCKERESFRGGWDCLRSESFCRSLLLFNPYWRGTNFPTRTSVYCDLPQSCADPTASNCWMIQSLWLFSALLDNLTTFYPLTLAVVWFWSGLGHQIFKKLLTILILSFDSFCLWMASVHSQMSIKGLFQHYPVGQQA